MNENSSGDFQREQTLNHQRIIRVLSPAVLLFIVISFLEFLIRAFNIPEYLCPAPSRIILAIYSESWAFASNSLVTIVESLSGFAIGSFLAIILAIIFSQSSTIEMSIYPYIIALKTTPIIAVAPIIVLWFGNGLFSKVVIVALISFFPCLVNTLRGLKSVDDQTLDVFVSFSATRLQILFKLRLPTSLPYVFSALKISSTLAVVGAIVGEFVGANSGLGFMILVASYTVDTTKMFAAIVLCALIGIGFFVAVALLEKRIVSWGIIGEV